MQRQIFLFACASFLSAGVFAQTELGAEYNHGFGKQYNGNNIGALYEGFSNSGKSSWQIGLSYNFNSYGEKSAGSHGWTIAAGYRYGFSYGTNGNLIGGARLSFSFDKDSKDKSFSVFSPSVEFGYHYTFNNFGKGGFTTPSIGLGYDFQMNAEKDAEPVHEGPLFNTRIAIGYRF